MKAPRDRARNEADDPEPEHEHERVRGGGEHLAREDLAALAGTGEDRLERAVVALRGDDVAGDERGDQGQPPDRHEEEDDERHGEARVADVPAERDVVRAAGLEHEHDDEDDRHEHRGAEPEVGALLCKELGELPAVDAGDTGHAATTEARRLRREGHERDSRSTERERQRGDRLLVRCEAQLAAA